MRKTYECGIDLGTTNSCIAIINDENNCEVIGNNADRMLVTPSAVQISKSGRLTVGQKAYSYPDGRCVKKEFKRDMGTNTLYQFHYVEKLYSPIELSSEVLKSVKRDVEARKGGAISSAVITVPAAFQELQIKATKEAADLAGFRDVILLQEPVAAAVAYGAKASNIGEYWLVFDYGGGTLDVAIVSTHNGELAAINNKGNNRMGGKDIDKRIYQSLILPKLKSEYQIEDDLNGLAKARALIEVEKCKMDLSSQEDTVFELYDVQDDAGEDIEFELTITRNEFNEAIDDIVEETINIARDALIGAHLGDSDLKKIVLVGGSTFVPLVREKLVKEFQVELDTSVDPMTAVARGAAMFASQNYLDVQEELSSEVLSDGIGVELEYDATTMDHVVSVSGRFINYVPGTIEQIMIASEDGARWNGGWLPLLDKDNGIFMYDVSIYNTTGENSYVLKAVDKLGTEVQLSAPMIEITFGGGLKLAAPPLPFNIGIMVTDAFGTVVDWLIAKNTRLPSAMQKSYKLNKRLDPKQNDVFELKVYEGEDTINPSANHLIGTIRVNSTDLPRVLAEGEEVEITLDVDISRVVTVSAYIPQFDFVLTEEQLMGNQIHYIDFQDEVDKVQKEIPELKKQLKEMTQSKMDTAKLDSSLGSMEGQLAGGKSEQMDNDDAQQLIDDFNKLKSEVLKLKRETADSVAEDKNKAQIMQYESDVAKYGTDEAYNMFAHWKQKYLNETDTELKEHFIKKMYEVRQKVVWSSFIWLKELYYFYRDNKTIRYSDEQKANYWLKKGYECILDENQEGLKKSVGCLIDLRIWNDQTATRSSEADIRL